MLTNNENRAPLHNGAIFREVAAGISATLLFFVSVLFIPIMGIFAGVFAPLPTLLSYYRWGTPFGLLIPGGALLGAGLLFSYLHMAQSIPYLTELVMLGVVLAVGMRRGWSFERTIVTGSLLVFVVGSLLFWLTQAPSPDGMFAGIEQGLRRAIQATLEQYAEVAPDARTLEQSLDSIVPVVVRILPGASLASTLVVAWLNLLVAKRYCMVRQLPLPAWGSWLRWKTPEPLVWAVIGCGFALLVPFQPLKLVALNALLVLGTIYLFQGLAIIAFYFERWKLPKLLRAVFYGFLLLQQFASLGAMLLGFFDVWFDFRRLTKNSASSA